MSQPKLPTLFLSHGGGPWPHIPEMRKALAKTAAWLAAVPATLPVKPRAILSISAHWEAPVFTVSSAAAPQMVYDYGGFPEHTYEIKYPAPGSPELAARVRALLDAAGIPGATDPSRGFDHGTFVPLELIFPAADVPVVSMSIKSGYSPAEHLRMGEAIAALRDEGVLIVGSGLSYHNMGGFGRPGSAAVAEAFGGWLATTVAEPDAQARDQRLLGWAQAPGARQAHPREDHLIPLMAVAGAAWSDVGRVSLLDHAMGVDMASYTFGG